MSRISLDRGKFSRNFGVETGNTITNKSNEVANFTLKVDPHQLANIFAGTKTHEVRVFERDYQVDSILTLMGYDRSNQVYTGQQATVEITNITAPDTYGLPANVGVMSIALLNKIRA